jgi:hypothetical protein
VDVWNKVLIRFHNSLHKKNYTFNNQMHPSSHAYIQFERENGESPYVSVSLGVDSTRSFVNCLHLQSCGTTRIFWKNNRAQNFQTA